MVLLRVGCVVLGWLAVSGVCACIDLTAKDPPVGASGSGSGSGGIGGSSIASSGGAGGSMAGTGTGGGSTILSLIDDCEDQDGSIITNGARKGAWVTVNDGTAGMQTPSVGAPFMMPATPKPHGSSKYAANTKGSGFTDWGAEFGFDLNNNGTTKKAYDASEYTGITFWAMAGESSTTSVRLKIGDSQTTPEAGNCGVKCSDDFGANITLKNEWQQYTYRFDDLSTVNWSMQNLTAINKSGLYHVLFQVSQNQTFDIWVDDVAFFTE